MSMRQLPELDLTLKLEQELALKFMQEQVPNLSSKEKDEAILSLVHQLMVKSNIITTLVRSYNA